MPENSLEWATWALVIVSGGLLGASVALAIIAYKAYRASQEQSNVMAEQVKTLQDLREAIGTLSGSMAKIEEATPGTRKTGPFPTP